MIGHQPGTGKHAGWLGALLVELPGVGEIVTVPTRVFLDWAQLVAAHE